MAKSQSKLPPELANFKDTRFDRNELELCYKNFHKDCPNDKLDKAKFLQIYQQVFPFGDPDEFAQYTFKVFDKDNNGTIDFQEFACALSLTSRGSLQEKLKWTFQLYDVDGNKEIARDELLRVVQSIYKMTGSVVELSPDEDTPEYWVEKIFHSVDQDGSNTISYEELLRASEHDPTIIQTLSRHSGLASKA